MTHRYEHVEFCKGRVCVDCGDHAEKDSCLCGWERKAQPAKDDIEAEEQMEGEFFKDKEALIKETAAKHFPNIRDVECMCPEGAEDKCVDILCPRKV